MEIVCLYIINCRCWSVSSAQVEETPDSMLFYTYHPSEPLSKERVEAFSDGVYAIVATLLILDIWFVSILILFTTYNQMPQILSQWHAC